MYEHAPSRLRALLLGAIVMGAITSAQAVDVNWGPHGPARSVTQTATDYFVDTYSFSLGSGAWQMSSAVSSTEVAQGAGFLYSIVGGTYGLYADPDGVPESGDESLLGGTMHNFNGTTGDLLNLSIGSQGAYYYLVTGLPLGTSGGTYRLESTAVAAVPEPSTTGLLLGGMALVCGVARRNRRA